jgi:hypothetical protein
VIAHEYISHHSLVLPDPVAYLSPADNAHGSLLGWLRGVHWRPIIVGDFGHQQGLAQTGVGQHEVVIDLK